MRQAPIRLRCELREDPLDVDTPRPRLSWWLNDDRPAELQTAYQIQAAGSARALESGSAELWDTGYVASRQTINVEYRGRGLKPGDRVWWRVRCYDSDGTPSPWSAPARFELTPATDEWRAAWIAAPLVGSPVTPVPVPMLYRDFELPDAPACARLHVAVLGAACLELNGHAVTLDEPLGPWHDLSRRVPCRSYDVTTLLVGGRNRLAALLGDGDYCGRVAGGSRQRYGDRPALRAELVVELDGGRVERLVSDGQWRWRPSWVLRADRDGGEEVDGRQYRESWSLPGDGSGMAVELPAPEIAVVAASAPAARVSATCAPVAPPLRRRAADGRTRLVHDFGRTLLGRVRLELRAPRNTVVTIRYALAPPAERRDAEAPPWQWQSPEDRYTARGQSLERFEPRFALHAFRYVEVAFDRAPNELASIAACEIATTAPVTAAVDCDHRLLSAGFEAAARTLRLGLVLGPVRGLAAGQRGLDLADAPGILAGAAAVLDAAALYRQWLTELAACRSPSAAQPGGGDAAEALLPCLWFVYRCYGDHRLLEALYPGLRQRLAELQSRWPDGVRGELNGIDGLGGQMLATAWHGYALTVAARMAGVLGRLEDLEAHVAAADRVRTVFRRRFLTPAGLLAADDQLGYLLALETGLLQGEERVGAVARLEAQLRASGYHPSLDPGHTGLLLEVLTLEGRSDLAYQVLLQTTAPGWLHPIDAGCDVLWDTGRAQPGRLAVASVAGWLQRFMLGLELDDDLTPEVNAYRRMRIQPRPPVGPGFAAGAPVTRACGHLDTVHGRFECAWRVAEGIFELEVRVPGNAGARVVLPDGSERTVLAGEHRFAMAIQPPTARRPGATADIPLLEDVSGGG